MKKLLIITLLCAGITSCTQTESAFFSTMKSIFSGIGKNCDYLTDNFGKEINGKAQISASLFITDGRKLEIFSDALGAKVKVDKGFVLEQFIRKQLPPSVVVFILGLSVSIIGGKTIKNKALKTGAILGGLGISSIALLHAFAHWYATGILIS